MITSSVNLPKLLRIFKPVLSFSAVIAAGFVLGDLVSTLFRKVEENSAHEKPVATPSVSGNVGILPPLALDPQEGWEVFERGAVPEHFNPSRISDQNQPNLFLYLSALGWISRSETLSAFYKDYFATWEAIPVAGISAPSFCEAPRANYRAISSVA
jgi:hypothetical protein